MAKDCEARIRHRRGVLLAVGDRLTFLVVPNRRLKKNQVRNFAGGETGREEARGRGFMAEGEHACGG